MRRRLLLAVPVLLLLLATRGDAFEVPPRLQQLLDSGTWDATPASFRLIALSHLADGCVAQARAHPAHTADARACVAAALERAHALPDDGGALFGSHLLLVYGAADALGPCPDPARHEALARELARRSLADPLRHAASYPRVSLRWPADQAVTLAGLHRFDVAHAPETPLADAPVREWKRVLEAHLDPTTALPKSELTGKGPGAKWPRGCAQSYLVRYVSEFDPALAASWWEPYRAHFLVRTSGVVGFREWPRGVARPADVDSGPIILGIGTAASAFAIAAAKSQGDTLLAAQLEAGANLLLATGVGGAAAQSVLAEAIRFQGRWQPGPPPSPGSQR